MRQVCLLSTLLFSLYLQAIFKEAIIEDDLIQVGNIRHANNTVLISDNIDQLHRMLDRVIEVSSSCGLQITSIMMKWMIVHRKSEARIINENKLPTKMAVS